MREIREQAAPVGRLPPEQFVRKRRKFVRPHQFLCHEIIDAGFFVNLRQLPVVTERIRIPADLDVYPKFLVKVALPHQNLAHQRLAAWHVEVWFYPHSANHFPTALAYTLLNLLE